jgi:hypothetical protein
MVWPLIAIGALIGAGAGYMATGDAKGALMGGLLGGVTGGAGGAALGGIGATSAATTGAVTGTALGGGTAAGLGSIPAATGGGWMAAGGAGTAQPFLTSAALSGGVPAGLAGGPGYLGGINLGMGPQALVQSGAKLGGTNVPLMHSYAPVGEEAITGKDFSQLGDAVQGSIEEEPESPIDAQLLREQEARGGSQSSSVEQELAAAAERMRSRITATPPGLRNVEAAKGGMMRVPSGSLTGGLLVGPGTGTSDSISSAIFPDVASKLGASSMQNIQGGGHVQPAALSDGEYVLTAKAVKGFGKQAGAPPGQEREYGSKLLDNVMNQMQRV